MPYAVEVYRQTSGEPVSAGTVEFEVPPRGGEFFDPPGSGRARVLEVVHRVEPGSPGQPARAKLVILVGPA